MRLQCNAMQCDCNAPEASRHAPAPPWSLQSIATHCNAMRLQCNAIFAALPSGASQDPPKGREGKDLGLYWSPSGPGPSWSAPLPRPPRLALPAPPRGKKKASDPCPPREKKATRGKKKAEGKNRSHDPLEGGGKHEGKKRLPPAASRATVPAQHFGWRLFER